MFSIITRIGEVSDFIKALALDQTNELSNNARSDLITILSNPVAPAMAVYAMERMYMEYATGSEAVKQATGSLAEFVARPGHQYYANGQDQNGQKSRAYCIWQIELGREGNQNFDNTVSAPQILKAYDGNISDTVPFIANITSCTPTSAPMGTHTNLSLVGSGFSATSGVTVGGEESQFIIVSDTALTVVALGAVQDGPAPIIVTNAGGVSQPFAFSYVG